jgi:CRISPR/Cas system Type II protein with McrA/HNH and RuvC-like nuclease domain
MKSSEKNFTVEEFKAKHETNPRCYLTGRTVDLQDPTSYELDHIVPATRGGSNGLENCGIASPKINRMKSDMTVEELLVACQEILEHHGYTVAKT